MKAGGLYLFRSMACSNTVYYEQLTDAQEFLKLAQQHLKEYLYIHEYMLCKDGWIFVARLKSKEQILKAYDTKRARKKKLPKQLEVWKIISEQMRLFISNYVTKYNDVSGREGCLVKRPYQRYFFETVQEAKRMIRRIRRRVVGLAQEKKMYRAKKGHYRIPKKLGKGGIYLSSKRKKGERGRLRNSLELSILQEFTKKVTPKIMKKHLRLTLKAHNTPIPDF